MIMRTLPSALVLAALVSTGCGTDHPVSPTQFSTSAGPSLSVTPSPLFTRPDPGGSCRFDVPFHLIVSSDLAFAVTDVTLRFSDTRGVTQPQVTLPAPVPITQFGTALADALAQEFALTLPIGCAAGNGGTLIVVVGTRDRNGRAASTQMTATVR